MIARAVAVLALSAAVLATSPAMARGGPSPSAVATAGDVAALQAALVVEERTEALYLLAVGSGRLRSSYPMLHAFQRAHSADRKVLARAIARRGAVPVAPRSFNDYVGDLHGEKAASEQDEVDMVRGLERSAADAYARLAPGLQDSAVSALLARLAAADAAHWRTLAHAIA